MSKTHPRLKSEGGNSLKTPQRKRASSRVEGRISWFFSSCSSEHGVPLDLQRGPEESALGGLRNVQSPCELRQASRDSSTLAAGFEVRSSSGVDARTSVFHLCILGFLWRFTAKMGLASCGDMQVRSLLKLEKQCQTSCRVDIGIDGFLSRCHRAVTSPSCFESVLGSQLQGSQV